MDGMSAKVKCPFLDYIQYFVPGNTQQAYLKEIPGRGTGRIPNVSTMAGEKCGRFRRKIQQVFFTLLILIRIHFKHIRNFVDDRLSAVGKVTGGSDVELIFF